jgi:hypothetical protein
VINRADLGPDPFKRDRIQQVLREFMSYIETELTEGKNEYAAFEKYVDKLMEVM